MSIMHLARGVWAAAICAVLAWGPGLATAQTDAAKPGLENPGCLNCHDGKQQKLEVPDAAGKPRPLLAVAPDKFGKGVHAKMQCVACHTGITDNPAQGASHTKPASGAIPKSASCPDCHTKLWEQAKDDKNAQMAKPRLGTVFANIQAYKASFHARPKKNDKSQVNAVCDNCHDTHVFNVPPKDSPERASWKMTTAEVCGAKCHSDELDDFKGSVHGKAVYDKKDQKSALCIDCHTSHGIGNTSADPIKLAITASCGSCHQDEYKSYKATYHGQISTLGYANTAKCFDCHGSHTILAAKDKESKVHPDNRLETCKNCHNGKKDVAVAPAGFVTFQPHGRTDDFGKYPQMFLAYKLMVQLLLGTFGFFWLHTALWFYREWKERKEGKLIPAVKAEALPPSQQGKHFKRFSGVWRAAHLSFAISLMVLTLTGMPLFYPDAAWAPWVMRALGGPHVAGIIHRVCAVIFAGVFFWHLLYMGAKLWQRRATFNILGPESMVPWITDLKDIIAMFRWFLGKGPRPQFDHWTYWEKFDYWAPFWGVTIIGVSGLMMWLPHVTGAFLPGWVFNVAAIFHGEEAFLAVVFLFTVHFFNNHFRPDKFPLEVVMFTGSMPLDHYKKEHALEYQRLSASGELSKYLVDAPSPPMALASKVLGFTLIVVGLTLLFGVAVGFFSGG